MAAQSTEKEETEFKKVVPQASLTFPSVHNCGLSGIPSTTNLCPKCFHASSYGSLRSSPPTGSFPRREVSRCSGCRRKVGLTGFRCRCGELFCADHRYPDRHDCGYDYKAAGREAIARENPIIKAAKMVRL